MESRSEAGSGGRYWPRCMREAPRLGREARAPAPSPRLALLVAPFYPKDPHGSFAKHVLTPALSLTALAAATPPDWEVRLWDENLLKGPPPVDPMPAVVGITVHLTFARRAYELARFFRERGAKVVLGGLHVSACPDEAAAHADAIALGEGAQLWPEILRDAAAGALRARYVGSFRSPHYAELPPPRRDVLPARDFLTTASLIATRGCSNRCGFCYLATRGLRMPSQVRPVADVARELVATGEPYGVFVDNNLGASRDYLRALCRALAPLDRIWSAAVSLDVTDDPALVGEMARAGCTGVFVGFETLEAANLDAAGKRSPRPADFARRVEVFHRAGVQVNGSFVFGFDHDGPDVFERTVRWIEEVRLECATFHVLTPYPGTPLFRQLEAEGRLLHRDWSLYDTAHVVFRPARMTPAELEAGYRWCYGRAFSARGIWARRPRGLGRALPYLAMSAVYKHANRLWPTVIRLGLTRALWRPLVELERRRHVAGRRSAASRPGRDEGRPREPVDAVAQRALDAAADHGPDDPQHGVRAHHLLDALALPPEVRHEHL